MSKNEKRTNVVLDEKKIQRAKKAYQIDTTRALLDFALDELLKAKDREKILSLQGKVSIDLNLDEIRKSR